MPPQFQGPQTVFWGQSDFTSNGTGTDQPGSINLPYKNGHHTSGRLRLHVLSVRFYGQQTGFWSGEGIRWPFSSGFGRDSAPIGDSGSRNLRTRRCEMWKRRALPNPPRTSLSRREGDQRWITGARCMWRIPEKNRVLRFPRRSKNTTSGVRNRPPTAVNYGQKDSSKLGHRHR